MSSLLPSSDNLYISRETPSIVLGTIGLISYVGKIDECISSYAKIF